jgi:hypothetical protein
MTKEDKARREFNVRVCFSLLAIFLGCWLWQSGGNGGGDKIAAGLWGMVFGFWLK